MDSCINALLRFDRLAGVYREGPLVMVEHPTGWCVTLKVLGAYGARVEVSVDATGRIQERPAP